MSLSTYAELWGEVLINCPLAGPVQARRWVRNAFRDISERRRWSWTLKKSQFLFADVYKTGTVAVTFNNPNITGTGTVFDASMVGKQFKVGTQTPIYTIKTFTSATAIVLDENWGGSTATGVGYEIYSAYQTVPTDFRSLLTVIDPQRNWRLRLNVTQQEINAIDPQRAHAAPSYAVVSFAYDTTSSPPLPRYEFWPHQKAQYVYPFLYESRPDDLDDSTGTIPRMIRGDVILEKALEKAATWPGPSTDKPNPYFNLTLAAYHRSEAERMIRELERQDDELFESDVWYSTWQSSPFAVIPMLDSTYLQSHAV